MSISTLLMGIIPLVVFVIIDAFAGPKAAVVVAILFAILEVGYTLIVFKKFDNITLASLALITIFGLLTYKTNNTIYFKIQPVVIGGIFAVLFFVMQYLDKPLLVIVAKKYQYLMPAEIKQHLTNPAYIEILSRLSLYLGFGFFVHSSLVLYSAFYMSTWWWLAIRGIGIYVMMFLCVLLVRFI